MAHVACEGRLVKLADAMKGTLYVRIHGSEFDLQVVA